MDELMTFFAPAAKVRTEQLYREIEEFNRNRQLRMIVDDMPEMILVLNECRQTVYANHTLCSFAGIAAPSQIYGQRPGEIFHCIHAPECNGCGTTEFCRYCGAAQAIVGAQKNKSSMNVLECSITTSELDSLELKVYTISWPDNGPRKYTMMVIKDISDSKWRDMMERIFFHDILNILTAMKSMIGLEQMSPDFSKDEILDIVMRTTNDLITEINSHRDIVAAEDRCLKTEFRRVKSTEIFESLQLLFMRTFAEQGKSLTVSEYESDITFNTDPRLLKRVISNMLKNAMEASASGDEIILSCRQLDNYIEITVRNPGDMPEPVQLQMFKRSFSTKGRNRGLGTYSMKMLTERYLNGKISFISDAETGTTFSILLPLDGGQKSK